MPRNRAERCVHCPFLVQTAQSWSVQLPAAWSLAVQYLLGNSARHAAFELCCEPRKIGRRLAYYSFGEQNALVVTLIRSSRFI